MAALATQVPTPAGVAPTYAAAAAGGDTVESGNDVVLHVKCGATGATVTVASPTACNQGSTHDLSVVIAANAERFIGPLPANRFAQSSTGRVNVTYSQVATVTVAAIRV